MTAFLDDKDRPQIVTLTINVPAESPKKPSRRYHPTIEKGVPISDRITSGKMKEGQIVSYPKDLEVGDSFFIPREVRGYDSVRRAFYSKPAYVTRRVRGGTRVWRVS